MTAKFVLLTLPWQGAALHGGVSTLVQTSRRYQAEQPLPKLKALLSR